MPAVARNENTRYQACTTRQDSRGHKLQKGKSAPVITVDLSDRQLREFMHNPQQTVGQLLLNNNNLI